MYVAFAHLEEKLLHEYKMCPVMPRSSVTSTVLIPTWNAVISPTSLQRASRLHTCNQLLWCMKCNTKYNLTSRPTAQQSGSLQTHSQPARCLCAFAAAGPRGCSARVCYSELVTLGTSVLALSHRGNPLSPRDHPHRRRVVCHPVPIDSTRGCGSAALFIGLPHPT